MEQEEYSRFRQSRIRLFSRIKLRNVFPGEWESVYSGEGIEFSTIKPFEPGDDVRDLDLHALVQSGEEDVILRVVERQMRIYIWADFSGSMQGVKDFAIERGAIIAEMVKNPETNFAWGWFSHHGKRLNLPAEFEKDAFEAQLFGEGDWGGTDCLALYEEARSFGAEVDIIVTDQGHGAGDIGDRIKRFHEVHPEIAKPKACVIVHFDNGWGTNKNGPVKTGYEENNIPVAIMTPESLVETAAVAEALKTAMLGPVAIIDEIMATKLLELPKYYYAI